MWGCYNMRKKRKILALLRTFTILMVAILFLLCVVSKLASNTVINNIEAATNNMFTDITNKAMQEVLSQVEFNYNDLANISYDKNGEVISVTCN